MPNLRALPPDPEPDPKPPRRKHHSAAPPTDGRAWTFRDGAWVLWSEAQASSEASGPPEIPEAGNGPQEPSSGLVEPTVKVTRTRPRGRVRFRIPRDPDMEGLSPRDQERLRAYRASGPPDPGRITIRRVGSRLPGSRDDDDGAA